MRTREKLAAARLLGGPQRKTSAMAPKGETKADLMGGT